MFARWVVLWLLIVPFLVGVAYAQEKKPSFGPYITYSDSACKVTAPTCRRIMVTEFFEKLLDDTGVIFFPYLDVNFDKCMVIAWAAPRFSSNRRRMSLIARDSTIAG